MKNLPPDCRPREKLLTRGVHTLSDSELLAILLRTGTKGRGVLQFANDLLQQFEGITNLLNASEQGLQNIKGLGPAKRAELIAVLELARRSLDQNLREKPLLNTAKATGDYIRLHLGHLPYEVFSILFLDGRNCLLGMEEMFRGTVNQAIVYPREVVQKTLTYGAQSVILAHNHPSGTLEASQADITITKDLKNALALLDIRVLDHIIVTAQEHFSMASQGLV
jgi:DNA repair protein RadC